MQIIVDFYANTMVSCSKLKGIIFTKTVRHKSGFRTLSIHGHIEIFENTPLLEYALIVTHMLCICELSCNIKLQKKEIQTLYR